MTPAIVHLYHHNNWANAKLIEVLAQQPEAVLEATAPGSYGKIGETLVHLVAAQERYVSRLTATERPEAVKESGGWQGFEPLRTSLEWSGYELTKLAEKTPDTAYRDTEHQGRPVKLMYATVLAQAINHATEHRVNITTILAAEGIEHPELDAWAYGEETWP